MVIVMNDLLKLTFNNEAIEYDSTNKFLIMDYEVIIDRKSVV